MYNTETGTEEGWVGHPLDPVGCLFDVLADASLVVDDQTPRVPTYFGTPSTAKYRALRF